MSDSDLLHHYKVLKQFLEILDDSSSKPKSSSSRAARAREKLEKLSTGQFKELSTDVYDELKRRIDESRSEPDFLLPKLTFHPKRNQARQKLSSLPQTRFKDLVSDISFEISRRNLHIPTASSSNPPPTNQPRHHSHSDSNTSPEKNIHGHSQPFPHNHGQNQNRPETSSSSHQGDDSFANSPSRAIPHQYSSSPSHSHPLEDLNDDVADVSHSTIDTANRLQRESLGHANGSRADRSLDPQNDDLHKQTIGVQPTTVIPTKANLTWSSDEEEENDDIDDAPNLKSPQEKAIKQDISDAPRPALPSDPSPREILQPAEDHVPLSEHRDALSSLQNHAQDVERKNRELQDRLDTLENSHKSELAAARSAPSQELDSLRDELEQAKSAAAALRLENQALKNKGSRSRTQSRDLSLMALSPSDSNGSSIGAVEHGVGEAKLISGGSPQNNNINSELEKIYKKLEDLPNKNQPHNDTINSLRSEVNQWQKRYQEVVADGFNKSLKTVKPSVQNHISPSGLIPLEAATNFFALVDAFMVSFDSKSADQNAIYAKISEIAISANSLASMGNNHALNTHEYAVMVQESAVHALTATRYYVAFKIIPRVILQRAIDQLVFSVCDLIEACKLTSSDSVPSSETAAPISSATHTLPSRASDADTSAIKPLRIGNKKLVSQDETPQQEFLTSSPRADEHNFSVPKIDPVPGKRPERAAATALAGAAGAGAAGVGAGVAGAKASEYPESKNLQNLQLKSPGGNGNKNEQAAVEKQTNIMPTDGDKPATKGINGSSNGTTSKQVTFPNEEASPSVSTTNVSNVPNGQGPNSATKPGEPVRKLSLFERISGSKLMNRNKKSQVTEEPSPATEAADKVESPEIKADKIQSQSTPDKSPTQVSTPFKPGASEIPEQINNEIPQQNKAGEEGRVRGQVERDITPIKAQEEAAPSTPQGRATRPSILDKVKQFESPNDTTPNNKSTSKASTPSSSSIKSARAMFSGNNDSIQEEASPSREPHEVKGGERQASGKGKSIFQALRNRFTTEEEHGQDGESRPSIKTENGSDGAVKKEPKENVEGKNSPSIWEQSESQKTSPMIGAFPDSMPNFEPQSPSENRKAEKTPKSEGMGATTAALGASITAAAAGGVAAYKENDAKKVGTKEADAKEPQVKAELPSEEKVIGSDKGPRSSFSGSTPGQHEHSNDVISQEEDTGSTPKTEILESSPQSLKAKASLKALSGKSPSFKVRKINQEEKAQEEDDDEEEDESEEDDESDYDEEEDRARQRQEYRKSMAAATFNFDLFDIDDPDNTLTQVLLYLEHQTVQVISTIQDLLTAIKKPDAKRNELRENSKAISEVIRQMTEATNTSMNQTRNHQLKEHGSWVVRSLEDCNHRMNTLCRPKNDKSDEEFADKNFKQRLAGISFDIAKCTKELVKTVEEASLKEDIAQLDARLSQADEDLT